MEEKKKEISQRPGREARKSRNMAKIQTWKKNI